MLLNGPFWSSRPRTSSHGTAPGGGETLPFMQIVPWVCRQPPPCSPPPCGEGSGVGVGRYGISVPHGTTPHPNPPPQGGREPRVDTSKRAPRDRHAAACGRDAVGGDLLVEDLIDRGLLVG